jgi:serine/threonine-protein kinase
MGEVFVARDTLLERRVALKVLSYAGESNPHAAAEALLREARLGAALKHPNIVTIHDLGEENGVAFIVMELLEGDSLRSFISPPSLAKVPIDQKYKWLVDVAAALDSAHGQGIVHRDVKPENVMITKDGVAKVLDFGIAKLHSAASAPAMVARPNPESGLTMSSIMGTPRYMAPERWTGIADARSDQFAWGVMAYELLAGSHPLGKRGQPRDDRARLTEFGVAIPISDAIEVAMASDPIGRHVTLAEIVRIFREASPETPARQVRPPEPPAQSNLAPDRFTPQGTMRSKESDPEVPNDDIATLRRPDAPTPSPPTPRAARDRRRSERWVLSGMGVVALATAVAIAYVARGKPAASAQAGASAPTATPPAPSSGEMHETSAPATVASALSAPAAPAQPTAPTAEPRRTPRPAPVRASCKIPYTVNSAGIHVPKPECL